MKTLKFILAGFICAFVMNYQAQAMGEKSIVEIAVGSKDHTTLVAALKAADLVTTLSGKGPFTVFAPTNAAFGKIPADALANLLKPENKATLAGILKGNGFDIRAEPQIEVVSMGREYVRRNVQGIPPLENSTCATAYQACSRSYIKKRAARGRHPHSLQQAGQPSSELPGATPID